MMAQELMTNIANVLSTITILTCLFLKVPQILHIIENQSADGIFVWALLMEVTGYSLMILYNYTNGYGLMTYLEYPIVLVQVYLMFFFVLKYKKMLHLPVVPICTIAYALIVFGFLLDVLSKDLLSYMVPFCTPLSGFAKVMYIYGIIQAGNANAVSLTTWIISVLTNIARIFTVYVDSGDGNLMSNFFISSILSSGVLATALYYQKNPHPSGTRHKRRRSPRRRCSDSD